MASIQRRHRYMQQGSMFLVRANRSEPPTGQWRNHWWTNGYTGPHTLKDAVQIVSVIGGEIIPFIYIQPDELDVIAERTTEKGGPLTLTELARLFQPAALVPTVWTGESNQLEVTLTVAGFNDDDEWETIEVDDPTVWIHNDGSEVEMLAPYPGYRQAMKMMAEADFDWIAETDGKRDADSVRAAYETFLRS